MKYYKIENYNNTKINNELINFFDPSKCYFKVPEKFKVLIKENEYVYKNQLLITNGKENIFSTISGVCIDIIKINNELVVVIENDYQEREKEKHGVYKILFSYPKEEILEILKYFDYNFFKVINTPKIKKVIINAVYTEPYDYSNYFLFKERIFSILETINALINSFKIEALIIISSNYDDVINQIIDNLGTFPNIKMKIISPYYPFQNNTFLTRLLKKEADFSLVVSINKISEISYIFKKRKVQTEKYITIAGTLVKNPSVVNAKIGTRLDEIIKLFKIDKSKNKIYLLNNRLHGNIIDPKEFFVSENTDLIIIGENVIKEQSECINCGLCIEACPLKLNPRQKNVSCLECNICSYVCPANINLKEKRTKNE